ncbi:MAG: 4-hydroxy-tetrahydrodipicolinate reductase [Saprospiraceae bacterium]|nr:4-hydroxy-tetrahydrodipicolinate reductase [Saprospiraceae bacterium]
MNIALIGYGKMGKTIERLALAAGHSVVLIIDQNNTGDLNAARLKAVDVAIEFSRPESAFDNICRCLEAGVPVICGTTGWLDRLREVKALCESRKGAFLFASNFSIGVNLFFALNRQLARLMANYPQYEPGLLEIHHIHKLDAPSGTAITLAEDLIANHPKKQKWVNTVSDVPDELSILSERIGEMPGTHEVHYASSIDTITIRHEAHSREGFAQGALVAAEWIVGKTGCFEMPDVLGLA